MGDIGKRTAKAIREMARQNETSYQFELDCIGLRRQSLFQWEHGETDPRAQVLADMALAGYDVIHILTGKKGQ